MASPKPAALKQRADRRRHASPCASGGYTLQETLITMVIVGMLFTTALSFTRLLQSNQLSAQLNTLVAELNFARIEAIKRSQAVSVCKSGSGTTCEGGNSWQGGWLVFADDNGDGVLDGEERILRRGERLAGGTTLNFGAFGPGGGSYLTYEGSGISLKNGTFTFCVPGGVAPPKAVILNNTGRPRVSDKKDSGDPLVCP